MHTRTHAHTHTHTHTHTCMHACTHARTHALLSNVCVCVCVCVRACVRVHPTRGFAEHTHMQQVRARTHAHRLPEEAGPSARHWGAHRQLAHRTPHLREDRQTHTHVVVTRICRRAALSHAGRRVLSPRTHIRTPSHIHARSPIRTHARTCGGRRLVPARLRGGGVIVVGAAGGLVLGRQPLVLLLHAEAQPACRPPAPRWAAGRPRAAALREQRTGRQNRLRQHADACAHPPAPPGARAPRGEARPRARVRSP